MSPELTARLAHLEARLSAAQRLNDLLKAVGDCYHKEADLLNEAESVQFIEVAQNVGLLLDVILDRHQADLGQFTADAAQESEESDAAG